MTDPPFTPRSQESVTTIAGRRRLLAVAEVAETIGLSESAVYRAIATGELRASKLRGRLRVQLSDLDSWIESNLVRPEARWHTRLVTDRPLVRTGGSGLRELLRQET